MLRGHPSFSSSPLHPASVPPLHRERCSITHYVGQRSRPEAASSQRPVWEDAAPFSNWAQISFPAIQAAMTSLAEWGVTVLVGDEVYKQHDPGTGGKYIHLFPWHLAWQAILEHPWLADDLSAT